MIYELFTVSDGYGYHVINNIGTIVLVQEFDPEEPGFVPMNEERAGMLAQSVVDEYSNRPQPEVPEEPKTPEQIRIGQLESENALMALDLINTQISLEQTQSEQAALLLALIDGGVL